MNFSKQVIKTQNTGAFAINDQSDYTTVVTRKMALSLHILLPMGRINRQLYQKMFGIDTHHHPFEFSSGEVLVDKNALKYERQQIFQKIKQDPNYLKKISQQCFSDGKKLFKLSLKYHHPKTKLNKLSSKILQAYIQSAFEEIVKFSAYLLFPISLQNYLEKYLRERIDKKIKSPNKARQIFNILTSPIKPNLSFYEQINILKLAILYQKYGGLTKKFENKINQYLTKFQTLGIKYGIGNKWTHREVIERIAYLSRQKPKGKLERMINRQVKNSQIKKILKILAEDDKFNQMVKIARTYVYLRTYRTDIISLSFANLFPIFDEIGRRHQLTKEQVTACLPQEIISFNFPSPSLIQTRLKNYVIRGEKEKIYFMHGEKARQISLEILKQINQTLETKSINVIQGTPANKGKVTGYAKIIFSNQDLKKINQGDILVSPMTTPDYLPAMERAGAFVTDEGGILSHAAIVSRELNKPCIINTKIATKYLKDNDLVEVDANRGSVKILKK